MNKYKVAIHTPVKNEHCLKEWILHYKNLGFNYFIIFDDKSDIPVETYFKNINVDFTILRDEQPVFDISFVKKNRSFSRKELLEDKVFPLCREKKIDYLAIFDADEYLYFKNFKDVNQMIDYYNPFDTIKINWLIYKCDKYEIKNNSLKNEFLYSQRYLLSYYKSLTKVSSILSSVHNSAHYISLKKTQ